MTNTKNIQFVHMITVHTVSYTHLRAHETRGNLVCRLLLEKKKKKIKSKIGMQIYQKIIQK